MDEALRTIEARYNLASQNDDLDSLKVEANKIKNLNKLIKLFFTYLKKFNDLISHKHNQREVFLRWIKDANKAIEAFLSINLNQEIGNGELMREKIKDIQNKLLEALSTRLNKFNHYILQINKLKNKIATQK